MAADYPGARDAPPRKRDGRPQAAGKNGRPQAAGKKRPPAGGRRQACDADPQVPVAQAIS